MNAFIGALFVVPLRLHVAPSEVCAECTPGLEPLQIEPARAVLPNLFSTAAHFLGTAHQTAHCIYGT